MDETWRALLGDLAALHWTSRTAQGPTVRVDGVELNGSPIATLRLTEHAATAEATVLADRADLEGWLARHEVPPPPHWRPFANRIPDAIREDAEAAWAFLLDDVGSYAWALDESRLRLLDVVHEADRATLTLGRGDHRWELRVELLHEELSLTGIAIEAALATSETDAPGQTFARPGWQLTRMT